MKDLFLTFFLRTDTIFFQRFFKQHFFKHERNKFSTHFEKLLRAADVVEQVLPQGDLGFPRAMDHRHVVLGKIFDELHDGGEKRIRYRFRRRGFFLQHLRYSDEHI